MAASAAVEKPVTTTTTSAAVLYPAYFGRNREHEINLATPSPKVAAVPGVSATAKVATAMVATAKVTTEKVAAATATSEPTASATEFGRGRDQEMAKAYDRATGFALFTSSQENKGKKRLLLGRFEVGKMLGRGTFAKVYVARNISTDELVAIKALDKEMVLRGGLVGHIKREIAALRRVRHPNIVHLHEVMATKAKIYFVMEYVRGGELFSRVSKGRLREETARKYFQQLISAVAFCHSRGVFHRDLKPENLLVDEEGNLKVSDFGLSAVSEQMRSDEILQTFCGTPAYVAPEVLSRRGYDGSMVDIWSCGVILYVLMAGTLPFYDRNIVVLYRKIYKGEFRCPRWFSTELVQFLHRLLVTNPKERITIPEIMEDPWFKKDFRYVRFYMEDDQFHPISDSETSTPLQPISEPQESGDLQPDEKSEMSDSDATVVSAPPVMSEEHHKRLGLPRPPTLNAFDIISFSRGFDLSRLFDQEAVGKRRFLSREPVSKIIAKLEEIAKVVKFKFRRKDSLLSLEGRKEGKKGALSISMEISELAPGMVVLEVRKKSGDKDQYNEFFRKELKPGLRHLMCESPIVSKTPSPSPALHKSGK